MSEEPVKCPKCGSTQVHAEKRGWNLWTGFLGSSRIFITCLKCGNRFLPGAVAAVRGERIRARVTQIKDFGAFASLPNGEEALIHISNLSTDYGRRVQDRVSVGDEVTVEVLAVDSLGRPRLGLVEESGDTPAQKP